MDASPFAKQKAALLRELKNFGIKDARVLRAIKSTPREAFMAAGMQEKAYLNTAFPIGEEQTISQPYIVAFMTEALKLTPGVSVLEIGTGSGYQAAILSKLAKHVYTIERHTSLSLQAQKRFDAMALSNITTRIGDGSQGWPEHSPFDRIMATAAAKHIPQSLVNQLAMGGIMVIPVEGDYGQELLRLTKIQEGIKTERLLGVVFVPLVEGKAE